MEPNQNTAPEPIEPPQTVGIPPKPLTQPNQPQPAAPAPERNRGLEMVIPINRSGWSIAAGYVALFNIPFIILAPFSVFLGIMGLNDLKKNPSRAGRGRCWFAIVYGGATIALFTTLWFIRTRS